MLKAIKNLLSRKPKSKGYLVPKEDYELLQFINWKVAQNEMVHIHGTDNNQTVHKLANLLYEYYGADKMEILIKLGVWVDVPIEKM